MPMSDKNMTLRMIVNAALGAILIFALQVTNVNAQRVSAAQDRTPKSYPLAHQETYNRVLDIVFPRADPNPSKTIFAFVLRFKPYSQSESQVIIRRGADKIEVIEYTTLDGGIYAKLNELIASGSKEDAVELAKAIRVKRKAVSVPYAQVKRWYATFFDNLARTTKTLSVKGEEFDRTGGSVTVFLHGAVYDLWYEQGLNQLSFRLYDVDLDDVRSSAVFELVRWMDTVRRTIAELKQ
jgi:vacuolar-type H+-ATPase subunit I/STV1